MNFPVMKGTERMLLHVLDEVAFLGKRLVTQFALVWPLALVHADVVSEVPSLFKRFTSPFDQTYQLFYFSSGLRVGDVYFFVRVTVENFLILEFSFGSIRKV